jgi:hypothetical protein
MMNRRVLMTAMMTGAAVLAAKGFAQDTANVPVRPNTAAIALQNAKQILALMDTDKDGRISKKEWMDFMSKEFDRVDKDHNGYIDQKELLSTMIQVQRPSPAVMGK